jgi:hypothetical protein
MASSKYQDHSDQLDQGEDVLPAFWEWLRVQESKWRYDAAMKEIQLSRGAAAEHALVQRASLTRQKCLALAWCFMIIVGGALAWQYGDDAIQHIVRNWEIRLISLTSVLDASSPTSSNIAAERASKSSDQARIADRLQTAPINQAGSPATRSSAELQHQLDSIGNDIAVVRGIVDRLAARQEQMAQGITMLQFTEHNVIEGLSSLPQSTNGNFLQHQNIQRVVRSEGVVQLNPVHNRPGPAQTPLPLR